MKLSCYRVVCVSSVLLSGWTTSAVAGDPHSEAAVLSTYRLYEKAIRSGDGELYYKVQSESKKGIEFVQEIRKRGLPPRPEIKLIPSQVTVQSKRAAVFGKFSTDSATQEHAVLLVLERGAWRIKKEKLASDPIHRPAFLPPEEGRFSKAGSPWHQIPRVDLPSLPDKEKAANWGIQAATDESFLYLRLSSNSKLPDVRTPVAKQPISFDDFGIPRLPSTEISVDVKEPQRPFRLTVGVVATVRWSEGTQTYSLNYGVTLCAGSGDILFATHATEGNGIITVEGHVILLRVPVASLAASNPGSIGLRLGPSEPKLVHMPTSYK